MFVDFSKAFDRLNHETLIQKLYILGVRGVALELIKSYLRNRNQCVEINKNQSDVRKLTASVPQGSILGPLLFDLYINDIVNIDDTISYIIYADDTSVFFSGDNADQIIVRANQYLDKLNAWTISNSLIINVNKTKAVLFRSRNTKCTYMPFLSLGGNNIDIVENVKVLGIIFNEHMLWDETVQQISNKLSKVVGIIYKYRNMIPISVMLLIYKSLFYTHYNYCFLVWGNTTATNLNLIQIRQKKSNPRIWHAAYDSHTKPLFDKFNIVQIPNHYSYKLALSYKRSFRHNENIYLSISQLELRQTIYPTRNAEIWLVPHSRTNY